MHLSAFLWEASWYVYLCKIDTICHQLWVSITGAIDTFFCAATTCTSSSTFPRQQEKKQINFMMFSLRCVRLNLLKQIPLDILWILFQPIDFGWKWKNRKLTKWNGNSKKATLNCSWLGKFMDLVNILSDQILYLLNYHGRFKQINEYSYQNIHIMSFEKLCAYKITFVWCFKSYI